MCLPRTAMRKATAVARVAWAATAPERNGPARRRQRSAYARPMGWHGEGWGSPKEICVCNTHKHTHVHTRAKVQGFTVSPRRGADTIDEAKREPFCGGWRMAKASK